MTSVCVEVGESSLVANLAPAGAALRVFVGTKTGPVLQGTLKLRVGSERFFGLRIQQEDIEGGNTRYTAARYIIHLSE